MKNYIGLYLFERDLRQKMTERINLFVGYMRNKFENNPELNQVKTRAQWTEEFRNWSGHALENELNLCILKYLNDEELE